MRLPQFLNYVDKSTLNMTHEELEALVHEIARKTSETKRDEFLGVLNSITNADKNDISNTLKTDGKNEIIEHINAIIHKLERINSGESCLDSEYNEEWDDWYNSDADDFCINKPKYRIYAGNSV